MSSDTSAGRRPVALGLAHGARSRGVELARTYGIVLALVAMVIFVTARNSDFLSATNLLNITSQWAPAGIMAVGMTFVILTGGFDLSIASSFSLCAITAAGLGRTEPPLVAFAAAIGVGLAIGLLNGTLITMLRVNPFIATLGTSFSISGISLVVTNHSAYTVANPAFGTLGTGGIGKVSYAGMMLIGALIIGGLILARTVYGHSIYAVGGNAEASRLSGIRTRSVVTSVYVISGLCAALAGIITASQLSSAQPDINPNIVFDVITAVVVGGTSLVGGMGAMWRTAVGLAILATLQNGFNLLNVDPDYQNIVKGVIIVGALALDAYVRRVADRARPAAAPAPSTAEGVP